MAGLCLVVLVVAAFLPGGAALDYAVFELPWVLLPDDTPVASGIAVTRCDEQPASLLSLVSSRAPPASFA